MSKEWDETQAAKSKAIGLSLGIVALMVCAINIVGFGAQMEETPSLTPPPVSTTPIRTFSEDDPFGNGYYAAIFGETGGAEMTTLNASTQIDIWYTGAYRNTTDGISYSDAVSTNVPIDMKRPYVLEIGGTYYMYVSNESTGANGEFHLYTSTNKVDFTEVGQVLALNSTSTWDSGHLGNLCVWKEGATWYMLYEATLTEWKIGLATSTDGQSWTRYANNPVLTMSPLIGGCGRPVIARDGSDVLKYEGKYYIYYHQLNTVNGGLGVCRAYSYDLITWVKEGPQEGMVKDPSFCCFGDHSIVEFYGNTYLYYSPTDQISIARADVVIDNRTLLELLASPPSPPPEIWNQTSGNLASTDANWLDGTAPESGADILFNGTSVADCTWDLTDTFDSFTIDSGYTGIINQTSVLTIGEYAQSGAGTFFQRANVFVNNSTAITAGTLTGNTSHTWTNGQNFVRSAGTLTASKLNLNMTGDANLNTGIQLLQSLTVNNSNTVTIIGESSVNGNILVGADSEISTVGTLPVSNMILNWRTYGGGTFSNQGAITGPGILKFNVYGGSPAITMHTGNVSCNVAISYIVAVSASVIVTADDTWNSGNFTIINPSPTYTVTLDLSSSNHSMNAGNVTLPARAIIRGRDSTINITGYWDTYNGTFQAENSTVIMMGDNTYAKLATGASFNDFVVGANNVRLITDTDQTIIMDDTGASMTISGFSGTLTTTVNYPSTAAIPLAFSLNSTVANSQFNIAVAFLDENMGYRVYKNDSVIQIGSGASFSFSTTGNGDFTVEAWETKQISSMVVLAVNMVGIGIMVSVVGSFVSPLASDIRAKRQIKPDKYVPLMMRTVIFIVIGTSMWILLHTIAIG